MPWTHLSRRRAEFGGVAVTEPSPNPEEFGVAEDVVEAASRFASQMGEITVQSGGLINDTYRVDCPSGEFILQRLNPSVFPDGAAVMDNIVAVTNHVDSAILPRLRASIAGPSGVTIEGATWRAWEVVDDAAPLFDPTPARVASAARLVGRFHERLDGLNPTCLVTHIAHFHDPAWHLARFEETVGANPVGRAAAAQIEIEALESHRDLIDIAEELQRRCGVSIAHNDTKLTNFLFRGDEAVCLLDLDTVMPAARFWDVADLVRSAGHRAAEDDPDGVRHRADRELVDAILGAYRDIHPTSGDELELGCVVIAYEEVLRFLTDWLRGDLYWKTTSPVQNLNRARGQLVLLNSLRDLFAA